MQKRSKKTTWRIFKRKAHNFILKAITGLLFALFLVSACMVEISLWIPVATFTMFFGWLVLFAYANK